MEKLNIAELLKDCPKGMELDCTNYDGVVTFEGVNDCAYYPIKISIKNGDESFSHTLTKYGQTCRTSYNKCIIYPKCKTTWEGFQRPFKDGDVVAATITPEGIWIGIFKQCGKTSFESHCSLSIVGDFYSKGFKNHPFRGLRLATEEEKQKLFNAIKENGYKWNDKTKTLEKLIKPKFKVGDRVKKNKDYISGIVTDIFDDSFKVTYDSGGCSYVQFHYQCDWELVPNKFDITTLIPFESRVLVRDSNDDTWRPAIFGAVVLKTDDSDIPFVVVGGCFFGQCIPYESNEHLLGTTNDCEEHYKTWE